MEELQDISIEIVKKEPKKRTRRTTVQEKLVEIPKNVDMQEFQRWASVLRRRSFNSMTHQEAMDLLMKDKDLLSEFMK